MSIQSLLDFEKKANDYLNVRCNNLIIDNQIEVLGSTPKFVLSKQIANIASISATTYDFQASDYVDYDYSYDSGDIPLAVDGKITLPKGVYFITATINIACAVGGTNIVLYSLAEYDTGIELMSAAYRDITTTSSVMSMSNVINIENDLDVIFKLTIDDGSNPLTINSNDRSSLFSIFKLL